MADQLREELQAYVSLVEEKEQEARLQAAKSEAEAALLKRIRSGLEGLLYKWGTP